MNKLRFARNLIANIVIFYLIFSSITGLLGFVVGAPITLEPFAFTLHHVTPLAFGLLLVWGFGAFAVELRDLSDYLSVMVFVVGATILVTLTTPGNLLFLHRLAGRALVDLTP